MTKGKIVFTGSFWEYFIFAIGLMALTICTFGILFPYFVYWSFKYFFANMEIEIYGGNNVSLSIPNA